MSRVAIGVSAIAVLGLLALVLPASEKKPAPAQVLVDAKELAELRAKVKALELRVDTLEKRSPQLLLTDTDARTRLFQEWIQTERRRQGMTTEGQQAVPEAAVERLRQGMLGEGSIPNVWSQGEINGITYFIIPLTASQNGDSQTAAKQSAGVLQEAPPAPAAAR